MLANVFEQMKREFFSVLSMGEAFGSFHFTAVEMHRTMRASGKDRLKLSISRECGVVLLCL